MCWGPRGNVTDGEKTKDKIGVSFSTHWLSSDSIVTSLLSLYAISTSLFNNFHVSCSSTCPLPSRQLFLIPFSPSFCFILFDFYIWAAPPPRGGGEFHPVTGVYFLTLTVGGTHITVSGRKYTPGTRYTFLYLGVLGGDF